MGRPCGEPDDCAFISVVAGRVLPMFTANGTGAPRVPNLSGWIRPCWASYPAVCDALYFAPEQLAARLGDSVAIIIAGGRFPGASVFSVCAYAPP